MLTIFESNVDELSDPIFDALINETNNLINYEDEEISNPIEINSFDDYFEIFEFVVDNYHDTNSFLFEQVFFENSFFFENGSLTIYNPTNHDIRDISQRTTYDPSSSSSNKQDKTRNLSLLGTAREKVKNAITGLMADSMFKKKNGSWNGNAIAEYLKMDSRTVRKHLKDLENE